MFNLQRACHERPDKRLSRHGGIKPIEPDVAFGALRYGASGPQAIVALVPVVLAALALLRMRRKAVVAAPR